MPASPLLRRSSNKAAALIIVLAFVVLLTGLVLAYFLRTTTERQLAQPSYNDTSADLLARSALDIIIGNFEQEIINGSASPAPSFGSGTYYFYNPSPSPAAAAYMVPQRSGNAAGVPNLIRRSVRSDPIPAPGVSSLASAVNSTTDVSANGRSVTRARWNTHYLVPKLNTGSDDSEPIAAFTPPDWVFVNGQGPTVITAPDSSVIGRYAYAVYDEGGLVDMNVAGYPTNTTVTQSGRKGSLAYADLTALGNYPIPNGSGGVYQVDQLVGWRNYATTQPTNNFPDSNFAANFQGGPNPATAYFTSIINNTSGFLTASTPTPFNNRTDQMFAQRQELVAFRQAVGSSTSFSANALQYLSTFSRDSNAPSFSPSTPLGSTIDYAALATTATAINPNFLLRRVTHAFTRFDGTSAVVGEPLVKTRFPLSRLAWITYKGPSAAVYTLNNNDPVITALLLAGVPLSTIQAGTAANVKYCFGLTFGGNQTVGDPSNPWVYTNHKNSTDTTQASTILRLDQVADNSIVTTPREPDFFELLQAGILSGSLGQSTAPPPGTSGGGTTGGNVFPDVHMSSTMQHLLTIGASIIDEADPDSIPTRIQFTGTNNNTWTAYGVENLPYITQMYPIAGADPNNSSIWATYLLFQLWNPHIGALPTPAPQVRLRVDGGIGTFAGGYGQTWNTTSTNFINANGTAPGQSVTLNSAYSFSGPAPLTTVNTTIPTPTPGPTTVGVFATLSAPIVPTPTATPTLTPTPTPTP
jgi:hypothetical protein